MNQVNYLGYLITPEGLKPDQEKTKAISLMPEPDSKDYVRRFLGMMSYYRRFIPEFSSIAACLFEVTKMKVNFKWTDVERNAFNKLKMLLIQAPVLIYPDFEKAFAIYTDASNVGVGGVLTQVVEEKALPVAFASRQLNTSERNYTTSEKEMLAIVWCTKHFNNYIYGREIVLYTDHKPLVSLVKAKEPNGRLNRLLMKIQDLNYKLIYHPGKDNHTADALSRIIGNNQDQIEAKVINHQVSSLDLNVNLDWEFEQSMDREISIIKLAIKAGEKIEFQELANQVYWKSVYEGLAIEKNVIYVSKNNTKLVIVPKHKRIFICKTYHDSITAGHIGFEKTYSSIEQRFSWPGIKADVYDYCQTCDQCQKFKQKTQKASKHPLVSIKVNKIWDLICIDIAGPLKTTPRNNKYFVIAIDHFSKFVVAKAIASFSAEITVQFLKEDLINRFGTPPAWLTDQGRNFEANLFKEFCIDYNIKKLRTTSYHPQCNALAERTPRHLNK